MHPSPVSFPDYLRRVRRDSFFALLQEHVRLHPRDLPALASSGGAPRLLRITVLGTASSLDQPGCFAQAAPGGGALQADLLLRGFWQQGSGECLADFRFRYFLDLRYVTRFLLRGEAGLPDPALACYGPVIAPEPGFPEDSLTRGELPLDAFLLPVLSRGDYPRAARLLLERYYPEALRGAGPLAVVGLARRMGLTVHRVRFPAGCGAAGRVVFRRQQLRLRAEDGSLTAVTAEPFTVWLNRDLCPGFERERLTLLHECAHVFLDLPFFLLQCMAGVDAASLPEARSSAAPLRPPFGPADWMELQARRLPAFLLLEESRTRAVAERVLAAHGGERSPENLRRVLDALVRRFRVSRAMARLRLMELGWPEAEGVCCWLEGRPVPDFCCSGPWVPGRSYLLSAAEAFRLYGSDRGFRGLIDSGAWLLAEGHCCRNDPRFVRRRPGQEPALTPWARRHIDLCCIAFTVQGARRPGVPFEAGAAAMLTEDTLHYRLPEPDLIPGTVAWDRANALAWEDARLWEAMLTDLDTAPGTKEAVNRLRLRKGLSWEALALEIGVNRKTLDGWLTAREISFPHVVAICVGLHLRGDVGLRLLEVTECRTRHHPHAGLYRQMICFALSYSVERCNAILALEHLPPLHAGDMLAG